MVRRVSAVCAFLLLFASAAFAQSRDEVRFGQDVTVPSEQTVHDVVCFLCSVHVDGAVHGDIVVLAGNVYLNGAVHGDVVDFGGHVTLTSVASVGHEVVVFGGRLNQDPASTIGRDTVVFPPVIFLPIILVIAAMIVGVILVLRYLFRRGSSPYPATPRY
jgi:hypothetical protein